MKSLQEFYDYIFGDLADVDKQLKKQEKLKAARTAEFKKKLETKAFFQKPTTQVRKQKTEEQKQKIIEEKIKAYFDELRINDKYSFQSALKELKSAYLEKILFNDSIQTSSTENPLKENIFYPGEDPPPIHGELLFPEHIIAGHEIPDLNLDHEIQSQDEELPLPQLWEPKDDNEYKTIGALEEDEEDDEHQLIPPPLPIQPQAAGRGYFFSSIPTDEAITAIFEKLDNKHHFFNEPVTLKSLALEKFIVFYKICMLIGKFIEGTDDDADISSQAYKMLVLFGDQDKPENYFKSFDQYLNTHKFFLEERPVHDALNWPLPINGSPRQIDLSKWRKLIQEQDGPKVFQLLFNRAPEIENKINRAPNSYLEGFRISKELAYPNENDYPELADLCMQYGISNRLFERCLLIEKMKKQSDVLPDLIISGSKVGKPGYYLVKLPINDPRAYLLGYLTNCCQSVGGASEKCVFDGITKTHNGFYVLLKEKMASTLPKHRATTTPSKELKEEKETKEIHEKEPIKQGKIDYDNFTIVGQGYAWMSQDENLVFDSWENLRPQGTKGLKDDAIIVPMLKEFAIQAIEKNPSILRVTIGTGGKTPDEFDKSIVRYPEKILKGTQYGDSYQQGLVYCDLNHQDKIHKELCETLKQLIAPKTTPSETKFDMGFIIRILPKESIYSVKQAKSFKDLLNDKVFRAFFHEKNNQDRLLQGIEKFPLHTWKMLSQLKELNGVTSQSLEVIVQHPEHLLTTTVALINLHRSGFINEKSHVSKPMINEILNLISQNPAQSDYISLALIDLFKSGFLDEKKHPSNKNYIKQGLDIILKNPVKATDISSALIQLNQAKFLNNDTLKEISENPNEAFYLAQANIALFENNLLDIFYQKNLLTIKNKLKIHPKLTNQITSFQLLAQLNKLDQFTFDKIVESPSDAKEIIAAIKCLDDANLYEQYAEIILSKKHFSYIAAQVLIILLNSNFPKNDYYIQKIIGNKDAKPEPLMDDDFFRPT